MDNKTDTGAVSAPVVNEKQNGKGLKIAVIFITLLALAGAGFGVYGMFFKKDAQPAPAAEPEAKVEESEEYYLGTVSGAQYFLNQKLKLPNAAEFYNLSSGDTLTEADKALLVRGIAEPQETKDLECETGIYISAEEYSKIYRDLFGEEFKYNSNAEYGVFNTGKFIDKPCVCECDLDAVSNGYYLWRTASHAMGNLIVEKVEGNSIYGKAYALYNGEFDYPNEPQLMGEFEVRFAEKGGNYYIAGFKYKML